MDTPKPYRTDVPRTDLVDHRRTGHDWRAHEARVWGSRPERTHRVTRWPGYDHGGHFPSLLAPDLLVRDIREFFRTC
ncbi:hypothetical protein GCM10029964_034180 [Kibdelosporangium lantanae]